jgi:hypothetical protein
MSRLTQARRWHTGEQRRKAPAMTENGVLPDEARSAMLAIVLQTGHVLERVEGYDYQTDRFTIAARDHEGKLKELTVYGETVARVVKVARTLKGKPNGLTRPGNKAAAG